MTLTVGSLFSGIGGIDLGLERAGMKVKWQVEIDPFCQKVLRARFPGVALYDDVKKVGRQQLERVDLICGGFPCQDISQAGRGTGISGRRSGLWAEYARIIRELRPRYVLVENVPTLKARGLEVVLADLAASGYDAEWDCIPAISVGAPHRRDRLFVLAYPNGFGRVHGQTRVHSAEDDDPPFSESGSGSSLADVADSNSSKPTKRRKRKTASQESGTGGYDGSRGSSNAQRQVPLLSAGQGPGQAGIYPTPFSDWWTVEPNVGRVANGVPDRVDRLRSLGNAVVPQVAEWIGRKIVEADSK